MNKWPSFVSNNRHCQACGHCLFVQTSYFQWNSHLRYSVFWKIIRELRDIFVVGNIHLQACDKCEEPSTSTTLEPHPNHIFVNIKVSPYQSKQNQNRWPIKSLSGHWWNQWIKKRTTWTLHWRVKLGAPEEWAFPASHVTPIMLSCVSLIVI